MGKGDRILLSLIWFTRLKQVTEAALGSLVLDDLHWQGENGQITLIGM